MRVVHARYSLENSVFSGVNIISVIEYFFWQGFDRNEAGHYFGNCKGFSFQVNMSKKSWHWLLKWQCVMLLKRYIRCEIVMDFLTRTGPESTTLRQCSCGEKKMGTFRMKSNSIYMNNTGDLLSGTLNRVHWQVLSTDHYFGSGNALGFRVNNMSWNHGIDYWKYHVLCS